MDLLKKFKDLNQRLKNNFREDEIIEFESLISKFEKGEDLEIAFYEDQVVKISKVVKKIEKSLIDVKSIKKENREIFNMLCEKDSKLKINKRHLLVLYFS